MHLFEQHYHCIIKPDFISKFNYKNIYSIPKITKIILNFGIKEVNFKVLLSLITALELISSQKAILTQSSTSNISLKIRKGAPVGCKVTLRKAAMYSFFYKLILIILPSIKQFDGFNFKPQTTEFRAFSFKLADILNFYEIESQYELFKSTPQLDLSIVTDCNNKSELRFLLTSFRFPIK